MTSNEPEVIVNIQGTAHLEDVDYGIIVERHPDGFRWAVLVWPIVWPLPPIEDPQEPPIELATGTEDTLNHALETATLVVVRVTEGHGIDPDDYRRYLDGDDLDDDPPEDLGDDDQDDDTANYFPRPSLN